MKLLTEPSPVALQNLLEEYGVRQTGSSCDEDMLKFALQQGYLNKNQIVALSETLKYTSIPQQFFLKAFGLKQ